MACQIHFWDAFINRQIDDVTVMNHNYEVQFRTVWRTVFNIQTKSLTDILILWPKIKLCKNADFSMKFSYGLCILKFLEMHFTRVYLWSSVSDINKSNVSKDTRQHLEQGQIRLSMICSISYIIWTLWYIQKKTIFRAVWKVRSGLPNKWIKCISVWTDYLCIGNLFLFVFILTMN